MSLKPKSTDRLSELKELMLGDELREILELRGRLDEQDEASIDRIARDLAAALRRRREMGDQSFDELVAAIQQSTESAIQRSVSEDKSTLSKALFPIMGPAIRNYVVDLFRGMVEEFNETIRDTTSVERIKWRFQAKLAGKSYSEFVMLKTRNFFTEEVYLMERDTGLLLLHAARNETDEASGEADLVSGMFTAIRSFVKDSFAGDEPGNDESSELDSFTFGEREVLIEVGPAMVIAAVANGVPPASAKEELQRILEELHSELGDRLRNFSGDMAELEGSRPTLRRALLESRSPGSEEAGGSGMWRAWVALGVIAIVAAFICFFGMRDQGKWNDFVKALRSEPGVAITAVENDGWWRHRTVRGLRDPLSIDPAAVAEKHEIDPGKVTFAFDLMASLDPAFSAQREATVKAGQEKILQLLEELRNDLDKSASTSAIAAMQKSVEGSVSKLDEGIAGLQSAIEAQAQKDQQIVQALIQSQFAGFAGLKIEFEGETVKFSGDLESEDFLTLIDRIAPLEGLIKVDASKLTDNSSARLAKILAQIEEIRISYQSGTLDEGDQERMEVLEARMEELDELAKKLNRTYRFDVLAHPLIGPNRAANRTVEARRAEQVREKLVALGISGDRIKTRLSEDFTRGGEGVSVVATEIGEEDSE